MKYFKKLIGDRIYLSPRNSEDVEQYTKWLNDFKVTDYIGRTAALVSIAAEKEYLEENQNGKFNFSIVTNDTEDMIGNISLENINYINREATLGIFIGDDNYLSKGYGSEAINLILDYGFNYLNLHSINLNLMEFNERAYNCYIKCGFKEYGRKRECRYINGKYYDIIEMDILKSDFSGEYIRNKEIK